MSAHENSSESKTRLIIIADGWWGWGGMQAVGNGRAGVRVRARISRTRGDGLRRTVQINHVLGVNYIGGNMEDDASR